jgi:hypothetical protein
MKAGALWFAGVAVLIVGTGITASPALAKCGSDCKKLISTEFKTCKAGCGKGSAGNACRKVCSDEKKADGATCKTAANPTPPGCGETTTTTTTTIPFPPPCGPDGNGACAGQCPSLFDICVQDQQTGDCTCVLGPCRGIGGIGSCGGSCPSPAMCTLCAACGGCGCIIPCNGGNYPTCNGTCPPSYACGSDGIDPGCLCIAQ